MNDKNQHERVILPTPTRAFSGTTTGSTCESSIRQGHKVDSFDVFKSLQEIQETQTRDYLWILRHLFLPAESRVLDKQERTDLLKTTARRGKNNKYSSSFPHTHISTSNDSVAFWENTNAQGHMPLTWNGKGEKILQFRVLHISKNFISKRNKGLKALHPFCCFHAFFPTFSVLMHLW